MKPVFSHQLRIPWILLGAALLIWLSLEDQGPRAVIFFSLLACGLSAYSLALRWRRMDRSRPYGVLLLATVAGLAVVPFGLLLMALKTGLHAHPVPDFTPEQIAWMVSRLPFWGLVGFLSGCSAFLWLQSRRKMHDQA